MVMTTIILNKSIAEGSQPTSKGSNDDAGAKDPMKTKELEDKFNGKILENGVSIICLCFIYQHAKYSRMYDASEKKQHIHIHK